MIRVESGAEGRAGRKRCSRQRDRAKGEVRVQKRQKRTDGQREREGETVRSSLLAARAQYLGSILLCGEEAVLRLV